jgi:hypothetical protein
MCRVTPASSDSGTVSGACCAPDDSSRDTQPASRLTAVSAASSTAIGRDLGMVVSSVEVVVVSG